MTLASHEYCSGCGACVAACTKDALTMTPDHEGFLHPHLDASKCIRCGACTRACPILEPGAPDPSPTCYAARTRDNDLRMASSSGGLFTELAKPTLAAGGIVFGCVWEKPSFTAIHAKAETLDELAAMRGSKYVQSDTRDTYRQAREAIRTGRPVLYTGTPCQIAGLKRFLGASASSELLTTLEIICHGTPSPAIWQKYKDEVVAQHQSPLQSISFRSKVYSWRQQAMEFTFADKENYHAALGSDPYGALFLRDLILRPSCYACKAREARSGADITIADLWGVEYICPSLDDDHGTSILLVHTLKGTALLSTITPALELASITIDQINLYNPPYTKPARRSKNRTKFILHALKSKNLARFARRATLPPLPYRIFIKCGVFVKACLRKLGLIK